MSNFSMIGLGDLIIPGLLTSMCARIDLIYTFTTCRQIALKQNIKDESSFNALLIKERSSFYLN